MRRHSIIRTLLATTTALALATGLAAHAARAGEGGATQNPGQSGQGPAGRQQMPAQPVTDEQLAQLIDAAADVQNVQANYAERVQKAEDQAKAQSLRQEAQTRKVSAVQESGLTVQQFNLIAQRLQTDQELAERLRQIGGS